MGLGNKIAARFTGHKADHYLFITLSHKLLNNL